jgi:hypothetical protein
MQPGICVSIYNDAANAGMLTLQRELGFVASESGLRMKRQPR